MFFAEIEKPTIKSRRNLKGPQITNTILKKNKAGDITLPDLKTSYKAIVIKLVWSWHKDRHKDQWNRTESPELNPHVYDPVISNKGDKTIQWGKHNFFNKWCWTTGHPHAEE